MGEKILARCHCGQFTIESQLKDRIPVSNMFCHCDSCRHVTGALCYSDLILNDPPIELIKEKLIKFETSNRFHRYFCGTCGSHVVCYGVLRDQWCICSGAIDNITYEGDNSSNTKGRLESVGKHEYIEDTRDGGLALCMPGTNEEPAEVFLQDPEGEPLKDLVAELSKFSGLKSALSDQTAVLTGACFCGGVQFSLKHPSTVKRDHERQDNSEPRSNKYQAAVCMCRSCRLSFGQPLTPWALVVPVEQLEGFVQHDTEQFSGTLKRYESSPQGRALRDFCGKCGASVFFSSSDKPGTVDIAMGLLRAESGCRIEEWFKWDQDVHYIEDAPDKFLASMVQANLKALQA